MNSTQSTQGGAAAKMAESTVQSENETRTDLRPSSAVSGAGLRKSSYYGMPCAKCHLYFPANVDVCPTCNSTERISVSASQIIPKVQVAAEHVPDSAAVEKEREAFLKEFKSQLLEAHAEVASSPVICTLSEHHADGAEAASVCKGCYDRLQERVDVCEAALHIELKDAAQIVYDAVWADSSDPTKTYTNAASALIGELRKRAGVSSMIGPFQPLGN
jgi:hypothetical protein